ncbi:MAG: polyribonucleotide nucleotidyltransferase [Chloroflexi bacterium]|nr:polyribonucleotide nucleotidyltransferase [Chloroflexota bacterium]
MAHTFDIVLGGKTLTIETGKLAGLADGAVTVRYGDTLVLATATMSDSLREGVDFFPLTVDFEERLYAAGKIPGGFTRREGRPTESAILTMRVTDRSIRPLFPKGFRNDVQIIITAMSADQQNPIDLLCIVGASAALTISKIPFEGPVGGVRVGYIDGQFVLNPTVSQLGESQLDLIVSGTHEATVMVEAGAKQLPEDVMLQAIAFGQEQMQPIIELQRQMAEAVGKPKMQFVAPVLPEEVRQAVKDQVGGRLAEAMHNPDKASREANIEALRDEVLSALGEQHDAKDVATAFDQLEKKTFRSDILENGTRPDGRKTTEIRPISCEVSLLPRTHGSGLFTRGQTQVLTIATLGSVGQQQIIDDLGLEERKRYLHHYSMPPFSTGEVKPLRGPGRREIGHGALAERALEQVLPTKEDFPYTIRLVSEVLSSNGSTSMASVCGSTLALMDAGVPIIAPIAGIAMGLITDESTGQVAILTDIQGMEDHLGDMDFKVAGSAEGVTALQMDVKVKGLSTDVLHRALEQAREARLFILGKMLDAIPTFRAHLSPFAPRILRISIPPEKIGTLIGPGGKTIRSIQEESGVDIDVEDDGSVFISGPDGESAEKAARYVERLTRDVEMHGVYLGKVSRITNFGAFVEILPGKEGLVRLGDLAEYRVNRAEDVIQVGDEIMVMVIEIDSQGRVNLSRRAVLEGAPPKPEDIEHGPGPRSGGNFGGPPRPAGDRRPAPSSDRGGRPPMRGGPRGGGPGRGGPPHGGGGRE